MMRKSQTSLSDSSSSNSTNLRITRESDQIAVIRSNFHIKCNDLQYGNDWDGVGYRSPLQQYQGSKSTVLPPHGGRSVREFEEQMVNLRKENFNLKLRLYFIKESIPGYQQVKNSAEGHETLMKQLIDTKVEMEVLRKELQEKQEMLKEAAQAMNQMEKIQKDAETKYEKMINELRQKLQYSDMECDMDKSQQFSGELVNDLLGRSDTSGSFNTIQKTRELEGLLKQSEIKLVELETQNVKLEELLCQRNETIGEYEEKVKELAFQNSELLESIEIKEKEIVSAERSLRGLRLTNGDLKADNESIIATLRVTQENYRKEVTNMKCCERQMHEQQDALSKMQSTISLKTANTARLLERILKYEKIVTKMNIERNIFKRENRFFRAIIQKLQANQKDIFSFEKEEIYHKFGHLGNNCRHWPVFDIDHYDLQRCECGLDKGLFAASSHPADHIQGEYKFKHKLSVNFDGPFCTTYATNTNVTTADDDEQCTAAAIEANEKNNDFLLENNSSSLSCNDGGGDGGAIINSYLSSSTELVGDYLHNSANSFTTLSSSPNSCDIPELPIRYTTSDGSLFEGVNTSYDSCCSLIANYAELGTRILLEVRPDLKPLLPHKSNGGEQTK